MRIFLKLGGSLITDKDKPFTARREILARIAGEISLARQQDADLEILLGHGSGSFGHYAARDYGTRDHVNTPKEWHGFQEVWLAARQLNQIVIDECVRVNLPVISLPPSSSILAKDRMIKEWTSEPIRSALQHGLIPVIYGDVVFDEVHGGIILSTEDLFTGLIPSIKPDLILLAGKEPGIWGDYPANTQLIPLITPQNFESVISRAESSASIDVTGGMTSKVKLMMNLVNSNPEIQVRIFSGEEPGNILNTLKGDAAGTLIKYKSDVAGL